MHRSQPFARAISMMAAISAALLLPTHAQQARLAEIGPYESRGKGKGGRQRASHGAQMASIRAARKARNARRHRMACKG